MLIFSTFFHFKFFKALTVNFSLIDHLLFFMCMQEPSSDTGFSPHRPEGFPNMLFFPLLRANMLTLFSAPSCSFFPRLSLSLSSTSSSLWFSGYLTRTSSSLSPRSGPKTKYHHTCLLVPKPEPLSHWLPPHEPGTRSTDPKENTELHSDRVPSLKS